MKHKGFFYTIVLLIIFSTSPLSPQEKEASVVHDPPPPFEPAQAEQYTFPPGNAVPPGDHWLKLPPIDYMPPPYARCLKGLRICLDPGHGGYSHLKGYKATASGYQESEMDLTVARHLRDFLVKSGVTVAMTRDGDWDLKKAYDKALHARSEFPKINNSDLFISLHHNAHSRKEANFTGAFYHEFPGYLYSNIDLGRYIVDELEYWLRLPEFANDGLYSDYLIYEDSGFAVLRYTTVPAILIEASFFSNSEEEKRLRDPEYLKREAWAYYLGIAKYVRNGIPRAELVYPPNGILKAGTPHKIQLKLHDNCPEAWGAKAAPRIVRFSINLTINDTQAPFEYEDKTGILSYQPPQSLIPGPYNVLVRFVNMRKNTSIPEIFKVTVEP